MVVIGGPSGVVEVGGVVDEGMDEEPGVSEELGASVVVEASTDETGSEAVESSGSGIAEEASGKVEEGMTSKEVEEGIASAEEVEEIASDEIEMETTSEEAERVETGTSTDDNVEETLGLHLPGRAEAEARKSGKSDRSRAVERVDAITAKERSRDDQRKKRVRASGFSE